MTEISTVRRRRADGERTRRAILQAAARLATTEGLDGLSIGRLASHLDMSKSGLYAHFGSKEELQLATIETVQAIFDHEVVEPAAGECTARACLEALCERFLSHVERCVFPGGCFFAAVAAELDTQPGRVRTRVFEFHREWTASLERLVRDGQEAGDIDPSEDAAQLAFEIDAFLLMANNRFVLEEDPLVLERARQALRRRLARR